MMQNGFMQRRTIHLRLPRRIKLLQKHPWPLRRNEIDIHLRHIQKPSHRFNPLKRYRIMQ